MNNTKIVEQLRTGNRSIRTWSIDVRLAKSSTCRGRTCKIKRRYIRPIGVGFTLGEEKNETGVAGRKFVDNARRDYSAITKREVVCAPKDFTKWWAVWKNLGPAVQGVAFESVVVGPEQPAEHAVVLVEVVIDANVIRWASNCGGRIPQKGSKIQAVTGRKIIR